jgi:Bacterial Ig-like domain (group 3)
MQHTPRFPAGHVTARGMELLDCPSLVRTALVPALLILALAAAPAAQAIDVVCPPNGSVTLTNPNPGILGSSVTAVPSKGVIEQSVSGNPFFVKSLGSPISWANNSIVNYRNTAGGPTDSFSIGGFVFNVTIESGSPPTPTMTTTSDVTITFQATDQAIAVSAQVSPIPPSGTVTFSIPGVGNNSSAVVNDQGIASGNFVVLGGTPSGIYPITATFNGPANYASSSGQASLYVNFFQTVTSPTSLLANYNPNVNNLTLSASVTSEFGGTVNQGTVIFTVMQGATVIGSPVTSGVVTNDAISASYALPAGTAVGTYSITAEYGGGGNLAPSTGFATLTIDQLNSYLCYKAALAKGQPKFVASSSALLDPLGGPQSFEVKSIASICAPADVNGAGINDPGVHQEGFKIAASRPAPKFEKSNHAITDGFGQRTLTITGPAALLEVTPQAMGTTPPSPFPSDPTSDPNVNRFKCYKASLAKEQPKFVAPPPPTVADALVPGGQDLELRKITGLCLPVDKDGQTPGAAARAARMVCYQAKLPKGSPKFAEQTVSTHGDFGPHTLVAKGVKELCVSAIEDP